MEKTNSEYYVSENFFENINQIQNINTSCNEYSGIHEAKKIRTKYDQFWLHFYDNKAKNSPTDLMDLQFAH